MHFRPVCASLVLLLVAGCSAPEPAGDGAGTTDAAPEAAAAPAVTPAATQTAGTETATAAAPGAESAAAPEAAQAAPATADSAAQAAPAAPQTPARLGAPKRDGKAHQYELRAFKDRIEVFMDGQLVPADHVKMQGNRVAVVNDQGVVIERLDLPRGWREEEQMVGQPTGPGDYRDIHGNKLTPPRVMLGGRLEEPSNALLKHLGDRGVSRERVSVVTNVMPNLPLARAGVENDDLIVAVNQVPDADPESIRAVVRTMKPGDVIRFRIMRGANLMDVEVATDEWDPKYMVRPYGSGGKTAAAGATAVAAAGAAPAAMPAAEKAARDAADNAATNAALAKQVEALQAQLKSAQDQITALEKKLDQGDPVRRAIRPKPAPPPKN
ncbi:MAG: PDZ domain-containing protein [Phycisphaerales bacterium]